MNCTESAHLTNKNPIVAIKSEESSFPRSALECYTKEMRAKMQLSRFEKGKNVFQSSSSLYSNTSPMEE